MDSLRECTFLGKNVKGQKFYHWKCLSWPLSRSFFLNLFGKRGIFTRSPLPWVFCSLSFSHCHCCFNLFLTSFILFSLSPATSVFAAVFKIQSFHLWLLQLSNSYIFFNIMVDNNFNFFILLLAFLYLVHSIKDGSIFNDAFSFESSLFAFCFTTIVSGFSCH